MGSPAERWASKVLSKMKNFRTVTNLSDAEKAILSHLDHLVGVYVNNNHVIGDVAVCKEGLYGMSPSGNITVAAKYADIEEASVRDDTEKQARHVVAKLRDGTSVVFAVLGGRGKFYDAYEFLRFLIGVVRDTRKGRDW
jgi:hypothetical protein